jgi:carbonic anhydrase
MIGRYSSVLLIALALSCNRQAPQPTPVATQSGAAGNEHADQEDEGEAEDGHGGKSKAKNSGRDKTALRTDPDGARFSVPFVWETSKTDPLAVARDHLRDILHDNHRYIKEHPRPRVPNAGEQRPSTTLVTCSDSPVQVPALDASPENDMFVVRNMGNQLQSSFASVAYGVEELKTPVLLIVGHTDCDAVHLAVGKNASKTSKTLKRELARLPRPKIKKGASESEVLRQAAIDNVHFQVDTAIAQFQSLVHTSKLTIVGAIYDPGNGMRQGAGKLHIINVNSNRDPGAMKGFVAAVMSDGKIIRLQPEGDEDEHEVADESEHEAAQQSNREETEVRPVSPARRTKAEPRPIVHAAVAAARQDEPKTTTKDSVAFDLDQLEATTRSDAARSKAPAVDPAIIEASLVDRN